MESLSSILQSGARAFIYFVGIKGTGVCALAELVLRMGVKVAGCDIPEVFYTDAILKELGIPYYETFDAAHITDDINMVIHSAAYSAENNPELAEANRKNIPCMTYPDALGAYSAGFDSAGVAGVHGKTTTTAMCGCLIRALGLPAQVLAGSAVADFNGRSTLSQGDKYFIAETCEYRKHFLLFHPRRIILTAVESDHQDFFPTYESIRDAFVEYCRLLPSGGELIYCADDSGACEVARIIEQENRGITLIPYGFTADGDYRITGYRVENDRALFAIKGFPGELSLRVPGRHQALNAAAAIALAGVLVKKEFGGWDEAHSGADRHAAVKKALDAFSGSKRRAEIIGNAGGIIFMDDYGHHPTAIAATLEGLRNFYPSRRLVVSFMSHTYTRTAALLDEFAKSLAAADVLFLHKIYASAREQFNGKICGMDIYDRVVNIVNNNDNNINNKNGAHYIEAYYVDEPLDAIEQLKKILKPGDLFLTMGAGNNWPLGAELFKYYQNCGGENGGNK